MEVHLHQVSKRFGDFAALSNVSLCIPSGRKVAIIGPNGSGKSTLTRIIMGMLSYTGEVRLDGRAPEKHRVALARHLAYVPQCPPLVAATVGDVVRLVARLRAHDERRIVDVATDLDLHISSIAERPLKNLSSGMKQKLLIALALAGDARLYILDEPTASLDPAARGRFYERFRAVAASATLLLCSHRLEEIQHLVDDVVLLDGGHVAFHGSVDEFLASHARCVIEVHARSEEAGTWLAEHGFIHSSHRAWVKHLEARDKLAETRQIMAQLNGQLENLNVRDLETISLPPTGGAS